MMNLGTISLVLFIYFARIIIILPIFKLLKVITHKDSWFHGLYDDEFKALFFQEIIVVATESYFELIMAAALGSKCQSWE